MPPRFTEGGLLGDRAYALVDGSDGKIASAKNPRKWPTLFDFRAVLADAPGIVVKMPPVRITLPDGTIVNSEQPDIYQILSMALHREVTLSAQPERRAATAEEYWPDMEGLDHRETVTDFGLPEGTFFDCAVAHLMTTHSALALTHENALKKIFILLRAQTGHDFSQYKPKIVNRSIKRRMAVQEVDERKVIEQTGVTSMKKDSDPALSCGLAPSNLGLRDR